jgi:hypothetical protein
MLAARSAVQPWAVNPIYSGNAAAYSDAFLALTIVAMIAIAAVGLRTAARGHVVPTQSPDAPNRDGTPTTPTHSD